MDICLVHGFNVSDGGAGSVGRLRPILEARGHRVVVLDYGWVGPVRVRWRNRKVTDELLLLDPDAVIGHSNAAVPWWHATHQGLQLRASVLIQPALYWEAPVSSSAGKTFCLYNRGDWAVRLGRAVNPFNLVTEGTWGAAGARGMQYADVNLNTGQGPFPAEGHSTIFRDPDALSYWGEVIAELLQAEASRRH